jgi:hypothetical protein
MANKLSGYIAKSGTTELVLSRFQEWENLGGLTAYPLGSTTPLVLDGTHTINKWSAKRIGNMMHLTLRYHRPAGATARAGGTDTQYALELPSIVNIDTKRIGTSTGSTVNDLNIPGAIIGYGYIMHAVGTSAGVAQAVLYDADARLFRILIRRVDDDGTQHQWQNSTSSSFFGFNGASTDLAIELEFDIPVTD